MATRYAVGTGYSQGLGVGSDVATYTAWTIADAEDWTSLAVHPRDATASFFGIKADGSLWGWGENYTTSTYGILGLGNSTEYNSPQQIIASGVASIAVGNANVYVVKTDGTLWAWGANWYGERGDGTATEYGTPTQVGSGTTWSKVAAGNYFAIALKTDGTLWSCGTNTNGRTGQGTTTGETDTWTQIGSSTDWADISVPPTGTHVLALKTDGTLWGWGYGAYHQFGSGTSDVSTPTQIGASTWDGIATSYHGSAAWTTGGALYVTGGNDYGFLGVAPDPVTDWTAVPTLTVGTAWLSGFHGVILTDGGALYGCGGKSYDLGIAGGSDVYPFTAMPTLVSPSVFVSAMGGYYNGVSQALVSSVNPYADIVESATATDMVVSFPTNNITDAPSASETLVTAFGKDITDSAAIASSTEGLTYTMWLDSLVSASAIAGTMHTTTSVLDSAAIQDVIQQAIEQLVTDTAAGAGTFSLGAASALIEIANAATIHVPSFNVVMSVAELIAAIDVLNGADGYDLTESGDAADTYAARVESVYAMLEAALATETDTVLVYVMQAVTDTAAGATAIDSEGSLVNVLLEEVLLATIYLNIGGELFTGWVLNTDTLAPSEYQFADRQFNSACKHGDKYLMASEDGIYEFTEAVGVESVMTYIKTGKSDFGSDLKKRVVNSYIVYSATGNMVLKVTTSEYGQLQTRNYRMVPPSNSETTDVRRFDIGRGVKSRYWQFELVGDGVDCDIDEIGMLPVVLSRRI